MPRVARIVAPGVPHHLTQRGNNRQDVFFADDDRRAYLDILAAQCHLHGVAVLGYCLMTNHVHLVLVPSTADALARAVGRSHWIYSQHINRLHDRSGHLWQGRFYSCPLDDEGTLLAMRYVEWNPVRARLCRSARRYPWSSAAAHCEGRDPLGLLDLTRWRKLCARRDWASVLDESPPDAPIRQLRQATRAGRPLAADKWIIKLEKSLRRPLRAAPRGRPRKTTPPRKRTKAKAK